MSVQNNLKKPEFTKTMLGYTPKEVDQYIDHILERYAAVSRDVTELKRRVTRLQLGMEERCDTAPEKEAAPTVYAGLSDSVMDKLRYMIESERRRHEEAMDALMSFLESHSRDEMLQIPAEEIPVCEAEEAEPEAEEANGTIAFEDSDAEWEDALEKFIADAGEDEEEAVDDEDADEFEDEPEAEPEAAPESADADEDDTDSLLEKLFGKYDVTLDTEDESEDEEVEDDEVEDDEVEEVSVEHFGDIGENEDETKAEAEAVREKTPAEIAAELDFYSDGTVHNGESYDPMTLAANATMKRRRPTLEDFMRPLP